MAVHERDCAIFCFLFSPLWFWRRAVCLSERVQAHYQSVLCANLWVGDGVAAGVEEGAACEECRSDEHCADHIHMVGSDDCRRDVGGNSWLMKGIARRKQS